MGTSISSTIKPHIEYLAFPAPKRPGYNLSHERLFFIGDNEISKIACMRYNENDMKRGCHFHTRPIIIYSHGNATDIGYVDSCKSKLLTNLSNDLNVTIISYDYPGYGLSPGVPSEEGCIRAINTLYDYLISIGYEAKNIILYGSSIGTGPTVSIASKKNKLRGVVLQTPYTSCVGIKSECAEYTSYACSSVSRNPNIFTTSEIIHKIKSPIIIIHGTDDQIIAYSHATELFEIVKDNNENNRLVTLPGAGHNNIDTKFYSAITDSLSKLLRL